MTLENDVPPVSPLSGNPLPEEPARSPQTLELIQCLIDPEGTLLSLSPSGEKQFSLPGRGWLGRDFRSLIREKYPAWTPLLPDDWSSLCEEPVFLPWNQHEEPGLGWNISALALPASMGGGWSLTLAPSIAPDISAFTPDEGIGGLGGAALHNLFFRTQQVEARFRQFLRLLPGVPYTQDTDLAFTYHNEQLRSLLGNQYFARLEAGTRWQEWIHSDDRKPFEKNLQSCLSSRAPTATRFRLIPHESDIFYILDLRLPVRSLTGEISGYEGLWLDLTRQTLAEKRLLRAAWKESLAEITGSLSHDFNNILTGIVNLSNLMSRDEDTAEVRMEDIRIISYSATQAQQLIQRIVSLNRQDVGEIKLHNLGEIVQQQRDLIRIILPRNVQFEVSLPDEEMPVRLDSSALCRILLNFATNARDALSYRGRVDILLREVDLRDYPREHLISSRCPDEGTAAELIFRDDGCGIDPRILHRIFGPYFSTKQASRGSGLGLYSMTRFAQENGFDFGVRSKPGEGTDMVLLIPLEELDAEPPDAPPEEPVPVQRPRRSRKAAGAPDRQEIGFFTPLDNHSVQLTRELIGNGIHTEILEEVPAACHWLRNSGNSRNIFFVIVDPRKTLPDELIAALRKEKGSLQRVLCVRGLNPDAVNHLHCEAFDHVFEEYGEIEDNVRAILSCLD